MSKRKPEDSERSCRPRSAGDLVGAVGGQSFRRFGFMQSAIVSRWSEIVGERYAKASSPESIRFPAGKKAGGALTLLVDGAHAPLIQHLTPMIVERVNRFFGYAAIKNDPGAAFTWTGMAPIQNGVSITPYLGSDPSNIFVAFRHSF